MAGQAAGQVLLLPQVSTVSEVLVATVGQDVAAEPVVRDTQQPVVLVMAATDLFIF
jgi:hypothetical protein